ncbi:response regulator transcription factor [Halarcobacter sp.]|uniref:response regulator transcription factor n=1 Tax=Halarcobacter sp. TaxID=2321133 RepID=UPI0029F562A7|nr:response regulator transcription factor [Halarcobacter sp.]
MNSLTLLYAEDELETRENYGRYLKRYFKEVYVVSNGKEALESYKKYKPNIMLLDINMPILNGLELTKQIREEDTLTRVIILTAHLEQDKLLFAAELNLTKYLPKPISRMELKEALNEATKQFKQLNNQNEYLSLKNGLKWNKSAKTLFFENNEIKLTKHETLLIELLSSKKDKVFSSDEIALYLWDDIIDLENSTKLKDIIKRLRKKLPKDSIENIYGAGYKLNK